MIILISQYTINLSGGVAKPGQTRRTQDKYYDKSRPLGVRGFESHLLH
jgi:hypothetical protein